MRGLPVMAAALLLPLLSACGGSSGGGSAGAPPPSSSVCDVQQDGINWAALREADCPRLSDYNLFDAAGAPRTPGQVFEPSVMLFSDYTLKYRVVFIPPGEQALFDAEEAFDFPVGSVISKTFSLPTTTDGDLPARALETRLMIRREQGWKGLPYVWDEDGREARLRIAGALLPQQILRDVVQVDFTYQVPDANQCLTCHRRGDQGMQPIGVRARYLNHDIDHQGSAVNQLRLWADQGLLREVPASLAGLFSVPAADAPGVTLAEQARGYLDINCSHCHREGGFAGISGLRLGFEQDPTTASYGVCKQPPGYDGGAENLAYDIVPGDAQASILRYRMTQLTARDMMPPVGRKLVHDEGVALISAWIDSLPPQSCDR